MDKNDEKKMTVLSSAAYAAATASGLTAQSAADVLMEQVQIRSFRDMLAAVADASQLRELLVNGLCANDSTRVRDSVDKKVRGWLNGKNQPTRREDLLELCFVLGLDVPRADAFLAASSDEGLHWRDPRELVYAYALDRSMSYPEALALYARVKPDELADAGMSEAYTPTARDQAQKCRTEEELRQYLHAAADKLGSLHNTAYQHFMAMLQLLESPDSLAGQDERRYSTREIVERYLDRKLPSAREGKNLEEKKRCVLTDWPDEFSMSRMKTRSVDVTRKVLMLLFLATDDCDVSEEEQEDDASIDAYDLPDEEAPDEVFESIYMRMNRMLTDSGFRKLDPRNAFDWLAIYCMRVTANEEGLEGLNEMLSHVLDVLFETTRPEET